MAHLDWYIRANLKPRHLQLWVALDDFRKVGKVAASLNITQPAVSKLLAELEKGDRLETLSVHLIRSYLQHSNAVAFLGQDVSKHYESIGLIDVLPLELPRFARPVGVAWSSQRALSPTAELLLKCLEQVSSHRKFETSEASRGEVKQQSHRMTGKPVRVIPGKHLRAAVAAKNA